MAQFALVQDGAVVEIRDIDPEAVASHKLAADGGPMLRPYVDAVQPGYNPALETCAASNVITPTEVTKTWVVARKTAEQQHAAVKLEARRRILAVLPDWKQSNMIARGVDLVEALTHRALTTEEAAEHAVLQNAWDWVKNVRVASNTLEAMTPIPLNFDADEYWPT